MKRVISLILLAVMFFVGLANVDLSVVFAEERTENLRINVKSPTNGRFFFAFIMQNQKKQALTPTEK